MCDILKQEFPDYRVVYDVPYSRLNSEKWTYSRNTPKTVFRVIWVRRYRW